jgi:hypothetical protein
MHVVWASRNTPVTSHVAEDNADHNSNEIDMHHASGYGTLSGS